MLTRCLGRQDDQVNPGVGRLTCLAHCPTSRIRVSRQITPERDLHARNSSSKLLIILWSLDFRHA
jgi:hypothetical protein